MKKMLKIEVSLKSDRNNRCFIWRPVCIYGIFIWRPVCIYGIFI